ncbi:hypothetical protein ACJMK2_042210 [Sinanodonta woodiana]|uniref:Uncharacterized protein n=1 Tax=Sinanodonta woodiana TaxID=1069815 RepID=A0ABD3W9V2_SINWO
MTCQDEISLEILHEVQVLQEQSDNILQDCTSKRLDPTFVERSKKTCDEILNSETVESLRERQRCIDCLQELAHAVLDYTYHHETVLASEDFPEVHSREMIAKIFCYFDKVEELCRKAFKGVEVTAVLGLEIVECLLWRRGALLYMFCSTVQADKDRLAKVPATFKQDIILGVNYLQNLLRVRDSHPHEEEVEEEIEDNKLNAMGIYSSTHLLSLVYGGEMCYWFIQLKYEDESFKAKEIGIEMLMKYLKAVQDSLDLYGWDIKRPEEFLHYLQSQ